MPEIITSSPPTEHEFTNKRENETPRESVNFSKCQMDKVITAHNNDQPVEYESFSPYLRDNNPDDGSLKQEMIPEDRAGLEILKLLNEEFPNAKAISLYDEYNLPPGQAESYSKQQKENFLTSIKQRLTSEGAKVDHFVSESSKVEAAKTLVEQLKNITQPDSKSVIKEKGGAIYFNDGQSEGGQYDDHFFPLRTKGGRWTCEALDASSFLNPENQKTTHLVILPKRFEI
ncbi:hypothetical protein KKF61_01970 [Patescibacteria group bacterium]|nr:hypothetical protein [Patescibacteria group bacterium]